MKFSLWMTATLLMVWGCSSQPEVDISNIDFELDFKRADQQMYACAQALHDQPQMDPFEAYETFLKEDRDFYLALLGIEHIDLQQTDGQLLADSLIINNICPLLADSSMYQLLDTIQRAFPSTYDLKSQIAAPIKRLIYHFTLDSLEIPSFRTYANGYIPDGTTQSVDQLQILPGFIGIGLHYFLGEGFQYYPRDVPQYVRTQFQPEYIDVVLVSALSEGMVSPIVVQKQPTLLDKIIQAGIKQYFMDQLLPQTPDSLKLFYSQSHMEFAEEYEAFLYKDVIDHLYDIDFVVHRDYLGNKPYSTHISEDAPPRVGQFIGWKIVHAYMKRNPDITLPQLCRMRNYSLIFKEAKYRPNL